jgi:hypothetical protein
MRYEVSPAHREHAGPGRPEASFSLLPSGTGRPRGFHLDCALAQRAKSLLRRAGDRCLPARGIGLPGEKTVFVRALAEIDQTTFGC